MEKKIIFIYHYRLPIFKELKKSKSIEFNVAAGINTDASIKVVEPDYYYYYYKAKLNSRQT